jgi:hypothetical protein
MSDARIVRRVKGVVVALLAGSIAHARALPPSSAAELRAAFRPDGRPRLVHLWATWCHSCMAELPSLTARLGELRGTIDPVWISLDDDAHAAEAARVLDGAPGKKLRAGSDFIEAMKVLDSEWDGTIPATYLREGEMKTTKIAIALAFLAGVAQAKAPAAAGGTTVEVKGHYYETCSCAVSCPCATNEFLPTESHCDALMLFHLDKASVGKVKLDGLNLAFVMKSPKNRKVMEAFTKGELDHWAPYLDDKATEEQRKAIPELLEGMFGKMEIKGAKAPAFVPITLTVAGDSAKVDVAGGKLTADIVNIKIGETKMGEKVTPKYIKLDGAVPFPWMTSTTQGKSNTFHYVDGPVKWDYKEKNAFFGEFTHKTTLAAAAAK